MTMKKVNVSTKAIANVMLGVKENPAIHRQSIGEKYFTKKKEKK